MRNIKDVHIELGAKKYAIKKESLQVKKINHQALVEKHKLNFNLYLVKKDKDIKRFLLIEDFVEEKKTNIKHHIDLVFWLDDNNNFISDTTFNAYCFFPTQEETKLKFILHAPFLLTTNRQNIRRYESWNDLLIVALSDLFAKTIFLLKDINLLNHSFFTTIPIKKSDFSIGFSEKNPFYIFFEKIKNTLQTNALIPIENNKFCLPSNAYLGRGRELITLLGHKGLQQLLEDEDSYFIFKSITDKSELWNYLINELDVNALDAKDFVHNISLDFISQQNDSWLNSFYKYLSKLEFLIENLKHKPIIRTSTEKNLEPYINDNPQVFLTSDDPTYPVVKDVFLSNKISYAFFKRLGLGTPDKKDLIYLKIIPRYEADDLSDLEDDLIRKDFENLFLYYQGANSQEQESLKNILAELKFLVSIKPVSKEIYYCVPTSIYLPNENINHSFSNYDDVEFFNQDFYNDVLKNHNISKIYQFLTEIGVNTSLRFIELSPDPERIKMQHHLSFQYRSLSHVIDYSIQGLEYLIKNIDLQNSNFIWDFLKNNIADTIQKKNGFLYYQYYSLRNAHFPSTLYTLLLNSKWLFNHENKPFSPSSIHFEDLNSIYNLKDSDDLIEFLEIPKATIEDKYKDLSNDELQILKNWKPLLDKLQPDQIYKVKDFVAALTTPHIAPVIESEPIQEVIKIPKTRTKQTLSEFTKTKNQDSADNKSKLETDTIDEDDSLPSASPPADQILLLDKELIEKALEKNKLKEFKDIADNSELYSFAWFKALLEIEYFNRSENEKKSNSFYVKFDKVESDPHSEQIITLSGAEYIPYSIEDSGELSITFRYKDNSRSLLAEAVSLQNKTLKAKLKTTHSLAELKFDEVESITIEVKNVNFIYDNLKSSFDQLSKPPFNLPNDYNFKTNLPPDIEFIFGPPGTGKTTFLAKEKIYPETKKDKFKILVLAPTNKAADVLTQKIIDESIANNDDSVFTWLVRFGITNDPNFEGNVFYNSKELLTKHLHQLVLVTTIARFPYDHFIIETKSASHKFDLKNFDWDIIIYDESSMINLPSTIFSLFYKKLKEPATKLIFGGDPFQIAPIVYTRHPGWIDGNIYSMVGLNKPNSFTDPITEPHNFSVKNLSKQFRSIPSIGTLFSELTYNGKLEHNRGSNDIKKIEIKNILLKPLTIINYRLSDFHSIYKPMHLVKSPYQIYSALFTMELLKYFNQNIICDSSKPYSIGVICPYRAQQNLIDKLLSTIKLPKNITISTGTIHGFQGDECDLVIAVFNPPKYITDSDQCFLNKQHIINVAISRARDYLIMLMPEDPSKRLQTEKLFLLNNIRAIIKNDKNLSKEFIEYHASDIEKILFGSKFHLEDVSFPTSHQDVNVYTAINKKYEIRSSEYAIDVQINNK